VVSSAEQLYTSGRSIIAIAGVIIVGCGIRASASTRSIGDIMFNRRGFLTGLISFVVAAPVIVRASSLMAMPRRPLWIPEPGQLYAELYRDGLVVERLKAHAGAWMQQGGINVVTDPSFADSVSFTEVRLSRDGQDLIYVPQLRTMTHGDSLAVVVRLE
jgi:hypothetical protein